MNLNQFINIVHPLSITSSDRIARLFYELENIRLNNIPGDLVECGVYKGGNILGMMEYCAHHDLKKQIWLYDTFSGMIQPHVVDVDLHSKNASDILETVMCAESLERVKYNLSQSQYDKSFLKYIVGDVCETLKHKENVPTNISLLRLDTDWYESTLCELNVLYPNVVDNGSIIIDDYGHWQGCKQAVEEYFNHNLSFNKIDYTGIYFRKTQGVST